MNSEYLSLSLPQVAASLLMVLLAMGLSYGNRSRLEWQYFTGSIRSFVQLWLMGYFLLWLFRADQPALYAGVVEAMIVLGAYTACRRQEAVRRRTFLALWLALNASVLVIGGYLFSAVLRIPPMEVPFMFVPLMGMVIGNSANGAALAVHRLQGEIDSHRGEIEVALSLGASPRAAVQPYVASSLRNALIPSINSMMLMGIVQLPGIMTGQMISGVSPAEAVRYQIVVVYMLAGAVALACHMTVRLEVQRFFTKRWGLI